MSVRHQASANTSSVFVGGIPGSIAACEVQAYFENFGKVMDVVIPPKKSNPSINNGYCYVVFDSQKTRDEVVAIKDHYIGTRRVSCKNYLRGSSLNNELYASNERKLFVKFVPGWVTEFDFKNYFSQFGELESYYMVKYKDPQELDKKNNSSVGYLIFKDFAVCETLVARRFFKIRNKKMQVERFDKTLCQTKAVKIDESIGQKSLGSDSLQNHSIKPTSNAYKRHCPSESGQVNIRLDKTEACIDADKYRFNISSRRGLSTSPATPEVDSSDNLRFNLTSELRPIESYSLDTTSTPPHQSVGSGKLLTRASHLPYLGVQQETG